MKILTKKQMDRLEISPADAAYLYGCRSYTDDLPEEFINRCLSFGFDPRGHFVWCYDDDLLGFPYPLTREAREFAYAE